MNRTILSKDELRIFRWKNIRSIFDDDSFVFYWIYFEMNEMHWACRRILCLLLTPLFGLFTDWSLVWLEIVWVELSWWIAAFNKAPTSLLFSNYARVEGVITEGCVRRIGWTSPTSKCRHCEEKTNQRVIMTRNFYGVEYRNFYADPSKHIRITKANSIVL